MHYRIKTSLIAAVVALAASAQGQNMFDLETLSPSTTEFHPGVARPASWLPYFVGGGATLECSYEYSIRLFNPTSAPGSGALSIFRSHPFITNGNCWGNDGDATSPWFLLDYTNIGPGASELFEGSFTFPSHGVSISATACSHTSDSLHSDVASSIFSGPATYFGFWQHSSSPADVLSADVSFRNELTVTTTHDLPDRVTSNGCAPLLSNSTGQLGELEAVGIVDATSPGLMLSAAELPARAPGLFIMSRTTAAPVVVSGTQATLCLGGTVYRWLDSVQASTENGLVNLLLPTVGLPVPGGSITPGESWSFQFFHRDIDTATGAATGNTTNAITVVF